MLEDVKTTLRIWRYNGKGSWTEQDAGDGAIPVGCSVSLRAVWPDESDEVWVNKDGYLQPNTLALGTAADALSNLVDLKAKPAMFNASGLIVEQFMAPSADGDSSQTLINLEVPIPRQILTPFYSRHPHSVLRDAPRGHCHGWISSYSS